VTESQHKPRNFRDLNKVNLCDCFGDENVASLAEIEVQFMQRTNMCSIDWSWIYENNALIK